MLQKIIVGLAALIVVAAAGGAGWWVSAEKGWIAGKANSPRPENFKRALDEHLLRTGSPWNRPCVSVDGMRPQDGMGPKDIRFDWTPASFRMVMDPRRAQMPQLPARYAYLAKQGFFDAKPLAEGAIEYYLTWKGLAASTGQGCFQMASSERSATVLSAAKKRTENGVDIYEVIARPVHSRIEPWASTPEFKEAFGDQQYQRYFDPQPVAYELARGEAGFSVIAEQGRPAQVRQVSGMQPAVMLKLAGSLTPERVKAAAEAWVAGQGVHQTRLCLRPPESHEADETSMQGMGYVRPGEPRPGVTYTYYNILTRNPQMGANALRGYVILRKFEALGFAESELFPANTFRDQAAAGGVRFTLTRAFLDRYAPERERCLPVGTAVLDEVVRFDPLTETNLNPQFVARVKAKPWDDEAKKLLEAFPHFARLQETGAVMRGNLQYYENVLRVASANIQYPVFHPDVSEVRLPVVEPPPPPKIAPPARGRK